jgi:NAD(P)-dependent dehydrogenase (short-subunit alcohol dehydrogenase family)
LTKGLAVELGPLGIRVNAVAPGYVDTPMTRAVLDQPEFRDRVLTRIPLGRLADGDDIADVVGFLASDAARYMTGTVLPVDGGYSIT